MKMNKPLSSIALSVICAATLTACGGGGGTVSSLINLTSPSHVSAGPIAGASIYLDMDDSQSYTAGTDAYCASTGPDGSFVCNYPAGLTASTNTHLLISVGGVDGYTGKAIVGELKSPPGATQVSPLTSLVVAQALANTPPGTPLSLAAMSAAVTTANVNISASLGLAPGQDLTAINTLAAGNEKLLAAETAVQSLMDQAVTAVANATGAPAANLGSSFSAIFSSLAVSMSTGATVNLATVASQAVTVAATAAAANPNSGATIALSPASVANLSTMLSTTIASSVGPTLAAAAPAAPPITAATIQNNAQAGVVNIAVFNTVINQLPAGTLATATPATLTAINNTVTNVNNSVNNGVINNVNNGTTNNITNITNIINQSSTIINQQLTVLAANTGIVVAPVAPPVGAKSWQYNGLTVAANGAASQVVPASGVLTIPAAVAGATSGLQSVTTTLIPNAALDTLLKTGGTIAPASGVPAFVNLGFSITPTSAADGRRMQVAIQRVPVTVDATGMHITSLAGATLIAYGKNSAGAQFNASLATLTTGLLSTASNAAANTATTTVGSTDVILNVQALFNLLAAVNTGNATGFTTLNAIKGTFLVSTAMTLTDALNATILAMTDSGTAALNNTATAYLGSNAVGVTSVAGLPTTITGQGKTITITLN
jgi:hypothetical protein